MLERVSIGPKRVRTLFLSDLHLGTKGCQADRLLEFLRHYEAETVYLVGDIVDGWQLKSGWYWPQLHNDVVQKLLRQARKGARLLYLPGNHDEFLRDYYGTHFGGIEVIEDAIHVSADGRTTCVVTFVRLAPRMRAFAITSSLTSRTPWKALKKTTKKTSTNASATFDGRPRPSQMMKIEPRTTRGIELAALM